jgi:hypothetical protein
MKVIQSQRAKQIRPVVKCPLTLTHAGPTIHVNRMHDASELRTEPQLHDEVMVEFLSKRLIMCVRYPSNVFHPSEPLQA